LKNLKENTAMVSVCMITYNHELYIRDALDGVVMQITNFKIELIIGEDCSNDATRKICEDYAAKYPKLIQLLPSDCNLGMSQNGERTLQFCKGKYIALLDGDDYWTDPLKLQKQVDFLDKHEDYILSFHDVNIQYTRKNNYRTYRMVGSLKENTLGTEDLIKPWFIPTCSILYRNLIDINYPNWISLTDSADIALMLFLSTLGKFYYLNEVMGVYRMHDNGISISYTGYSNIFSMIHLYQNFNEYTNKKYEAKLHQAMKSEIHAHLPEFHELRRLRRSKKVKVIKIIQAIASKIRGVLG